jgi:ribose transport system permease protein
VYKTPYGRHLYAVGGDEETARISGIQVNRVRALAYIISGFLAAATSLYLTSRMGSGDPGVGPNLALDAISAVLLGGTILGGGQGGLVGTAGGVLVLVILSNVFNQLGINTWYQQIAKGLVIILAVLIYPQKRKK